MEQDLEKNLIKLNNTMFDELDRLQNMNINDKNMKIELERARTSAILASQIINTINTSIRSKMIKINVENETTALIEQ